MFLKRFQKTINKCFRKIRNKEIVDIEKEDLFDKWKELKKKYDNKSKAELANMRVIFDVQKAKELKQRGEEVRRNIGKICEARKQVAQPTAHEQARVVNQQVKRQLIQKIVENGRFECANEEVRIHATQMILQRTHHTCRED